MKTNISLLILFIVLLFSFLLFHDKGNAMTKPHLEKFLNEQLGEGEHIDIKSFSVDIDTVKATLLYNQTSTINVVGTYSLLMQSFNLNYQLSLNDFKYQTIELKEQVNATGHASGDYDISAGELDMLYDINISDLSKLQAITKQKLYGSMLIEGEVKQEQGGTTITGSTEELEGQLNFQLQNGHFTMQMDGVSVEKVMAMLQYPSVFTASVKGEGEYNLAEERGVFRSTLLDAQLLPNNFIDLVKEFDGLDLSKEKFKESNLTATIEKEQIVFDFIAKNSNTTLALTSASIDSEKEQIDALYNIMVGEKDFGGKIVGALAAPNITIDSSNYIEKKVSNVIEKHSDQLQKLGIGKDDQKKVKEFLNNLFH